MALKTDYKDDVLNTDVNTNRTFNIVRKNGTVVEQDVQLRETTVFEQEGDSFGANDVNTTNEEIIRVAGTTHTNLLNPTLQTTTINGVTCTNNGDGTYTLNGTATANASFVLRRNVKLDPDKTYKIVGCPSGGGASTYKIGVYGQTTETSFSGQVAMSPDYGNSHETFNPHWEQYMEWGYGIQIVVYSGTAIPSGGITFKPMLTTDLSATYDDFVPYSGSGELNENVVDLYKNVNEIFSTFFDIMHPVGDLYITKNASFNPNTATGWKGTWERDKGRFVRLAGDGDTIGSTGGADERTLDASNLPSHYHEMQNHTHTLNGHTHSIPALGGKTTINGQHRHYTFRNASSGNPPTFNFAYLQGTRGGENNYIIAGGSQEPNMAQTTAAGEHQHDVTTYASTTGGNSGNTSTPSNNKTTSTGSGTAFDNRPFHENFYGWVRIS